MFILNDDSETDKLCDEQWLLSKKYAQNEDKNITF